MLHGLPLPVSVEQGAVTIVYSTGEEIIFSGTNTDSATTYLFVTGPGLAANGVRLDDVAIPGVTEDAGTFTRVEVELDDTWEYRWGTGLRPPPRRRHLHHLCRRDAQRQGRSDRCRV